MARMKEEKSHMERNADMLSHMQSSPKGEVYNSELMLEALMDISTSLAEIADYVKSQKNKS